MSNMDDILRIIEALSQVLGQQDQPAQQPPFGRVRNTYASEESFFKSNPGVAGMATEDQAVVLNPLRNFTANELDSVVRNERVRLLISSGKIPKPTFEPSKSQRKALGGYSGSSDDFLATIAARAASGDPSIGSVTNQQKAYVDSYVLPKLKELGW